MANKRLKEKIILEQKQKQLVKEREKLVKFNYLIIGVILLALLSYFFTFISIFNINYGTEVKVNGWQFFLASITNNYNASDKIYGDIAVPFYYYAKNYIQNMGLFTLISVVFFIVAVIFQVVAILLKKDFLSFVGVIISLISSIFVFIVYVIGLSVNNSEILPVYCSGNPACTIESYAIIPCIISLLVILAVVIKYKRFKKK